MIFLKMAKKVFPQAPFPSFKDRKHEDTMQDMDDTRLHQEYNKLFLHMEERLHRVSAGLNDTETIALFLALQKVQSAGVVRKLQWAVNNEDMDYSWVFQRINFFGWRNRSHLENLTTVELETQFRKENSKEVKSKIKSELNFRRKLKRRT